MGRPRLYTSKADKQSEYRRRKSLQEEVLQAKAAKFDQLATVLRSLECKVGYYLPAMAGSDDQRLIAEFIEQLERGNMPFTMKF